MSEITIAKKAGFCFGVRRAIKLAEEAVLQNKTVSVIGPIIHNPQEVKRLENLGIKTLKKPPTKSGILILRTHGIPLSLHKTLKKKKNIEIIDAVCPFVKRAQKIVSDLAKKKESIIIVGENDHPEIIALRSYADNKCIVIENPHEAKKIKVSGKLNIVSQTTQSLENFDKIVKIIKGRNEAKVFNTICKATFDRQNAAFELAKSADLMIVIGGKNSANTARLAQICKKNAQTKHIESANDLKKEWFKNKNNICLTAGASTPDWIIKEAKLKIEKFINIRARNQSLCLN
ncbi:MAG: 4-hydroxy-3-methylbut-2-enyl diphosphate reductase [Elusimicrobiota bacterium]|jgi:4-hydroxy-3-methylbut-2-enyl diphosphate reductase|nr:4-hydroxy-3-methylbut-2-enyl diphosphate reductase [Elusimicrobiota bacterium]